MAGSRQIDDFVHRCQPQYIDDRARPPGPHWNRPYFLVESALHICLSRQPGNRWH